MTTDWTDYAPENETPIPEQIILAHTKIIAQWVDFAEYSEEWEALFGKLQDFANEYYWARIDSETRPAKRCNPDPMLSDPWVHYGPYGSDLSDVEPPF